MEPGSSRLVIDEIVLPNTGASVHGFGMDLLMMMYPSGMERTVSQWQGLLEPRGVEIVKIWGLDAAHEQVIECQLKP